MHRVYVSAATQHQNIGVAEYGNEQDRMMFLADRVKYWLRTQNGKFEVFRNQPGWTLEQTVTDCNNLTCELFVDNHTDAGKPEQIAGDGGAEGTTAFYNGRLVDGGVGSNSYLLAHALYKQISPLSPGVDRGVKPDTALYKSGLYVVQNTHPPAALIEHFFHTNYAEVMDYLSRIDVYAKAEAIGICNYCGEIWEEPRTQTQTVELLVEEMIKDGLVTDKGLWLDVLMGKRLANPEFLQICFRRAVNKI